MAGLALAACDGGTTVPDAGPVTTVSFVLTDRLDLLFMLDDTFSVPGVEALPRELPVLFQEMETAFAHPLDLHAGVITSDLGAGRLVLPGGLCAMGGDRGVLQPGPPRCTYWNERFFAGTSAAILDRLRCAMMVGRDGCNYEHPLGAIARALDPATVENAGFVRADAHLAIVLLTNEDDCSAPPDSDLFVNAPGGEFTAVFCARMGHLCGGAPPPASPFEAPLSSCTAAEDGPLIPVRSLVEQVRMSKGEPDRQLTVVGIFGDPAAYPDARYRFYRSREPVLDMAPICQSSLGEAYPGLRIAAFVDAFGRGGFRESACGDFDSILARIGRNIARRLTSTCLAGPATTCEVTADRPLPACGPTALRPCWTLEGDPRCPGSALQLAIEGAGILPAGTPITARCQ
jgi:hypothetical protein